MSNRVACLLASIVGLFWAMALQAETLKVALYDGGSPPLFFDKGDKETGIYVDLLNEIGQRTGLQFEFLHYPTQRAMVLFDDGQVHVEVGIHPSWRASAKVPGSFTVAFGKSEDVAVFTENQAVPVQGTSNLMGKRVGTMKGFYYPGFMDAFASGQIQRKDSVNEEQLLKKLSSGRLDLVFIRREAVLYRQKIDAEYHGLVIGDVIGSADISIRIHPSKAAHIAEINAAISAIQSDGSLEHIYARYR